MCVDLNKDSTLGKNDVAESTRNAKLEDLRIYQSTPHIYAVQQEARFIISLPTFDVSCRPLDG